MSKLAWVLLPLGLLLAGLVLHALTGARVTRPRLNAVFSLLLLGYLLITAGLGLFWVANQQLPVFDWHYLFGYATLLVLAIHLAFNLRTLLAQLGWRRRPAGHAGVAVPSATAAPMGRRPLLAALLSGLGLAGLGGGLGYLVGLRHGRTEIVIAPGGHVGGGAPATAGTAGDAAGHELVRAFHEFSAHQRVGVLRQAPSVDWGDPPPPFKPVGDGERLLALPAPPGPRPFEPSGVDPRLAALAGVLWASAGISEWRGGLALRAAPSSGALFASEFYVLERLPNAPSTSAAPAPPHPGAALRAWRYVPQTHALQPWVLKADTALAALRSANAASVQPAPLELPPWTIVASAVFRRSGHKYR
ncbi:MAG: hypothetical protein N2688_15190, partial [Burkholderiaceae bacterium]|nr:hypothetical protein [Burkholderiaceae bacterium]